jgi:hypothetical protein
VTVTNRPGSRGATHAGRNDDAARPRYSLGAAILSLAELLSSGTVATVETALLGLVLERPAAVIVELPDLDITDIEPLRVLQTVHRRTRDWPATPLLLVAGSTRLRACIRLAGVAPDLPLYPTTRAALQRVQELPPRLQEWVRLPARAASARRAREFITARCAAWPLQAAGVSVSDAMQVGSELVEHYARCGQTPQTRLDLDWHHGLLAVAVGDNTTGTPPPAAEAEEHEPVPDDEGGPVTSDELACRWGRFARARLGSLTWVMLPSRAGPLDEPACPRPTAGEGGA